MNQKIKNMLLDFFIDIEIGLILRMLKKKRYFVQNLLLIQKRLTKLIKIKK